MKKITTLHWNRFKESSDGKIGIADFKLIAQPECSLEELTKIVMKYNEEYFHNFNHKQIEAFISDLDYFFYFVKDYFCENTQKINSFDDLEMCYKQLSVQFIKSNFKKELTKDFGGSIPESLAWEDIPQKYYKVLLSCSMPLTLALYATGVNNSLPNFFVMQFINLRKFAELHEIDLPSVPNRRDYRSRCLYYVNLCRVIISFFNESEITDVAEMSAYLFSYIFPEINAELKSGNRELPEHPQQVWLLVGTLHGGEQNMQRGFWQGNPFMKRGDLCLFYEKTPVMAMTSAWTVLEDGVVDPFFYFYSNTFIGNRIDIPHISYDEFIANEYFKERNSEGNYVSKHFQDCSGWNITSKDYDEIKRLLQEKGYNVANLPTLPKYEPIQGVEITLEKHVTEKLLMPLLDRMGYVYKKDYFTEVEFTAGHGETGYGLDKRPDVCLHMTGSGKNIGAQVVIEMKLYISNDKHLEEDFAQGLSYAKYGEADVYCLADKVGIYVFQREKGKKFDFNKRTHFTWADMADYDKYIHLKQLFEKK